MHRSRLCLLLFIVYGAYHLLFLLNYWATPLGRVPALDGSELFMLIQTIQNNALPQEPQYRAMLYPLVLSQLIPGNTSPQSFMIVAGLLGWLFHSMNTLLVFKISQQWSRHFYGSLLAALVYAFYPVCTYFYADPLDITFSITLMLASVYFSIESFSTHSKKDILFSGFFLAFAILARPNFALLIIPFCGILFFDGWKRRSFQGSWALLALMSVLIFQGFIQYLSCAQFKVLPWQGAYNLYAANKETANGKYYQQSIHFSSLPRGMNPTRAESTYLFEQQFPASSGDIAAQNSYWRNKAIDACLADPMRVMKLWLKKLYFCYNNFEQYNNKTYAFHRALNPYLCLNPLCFALVFTLSVTALCASSQKPTQSIFVYWFLCLGFITASILLFFASARFRLPLLSLLCLPLSLLPYFSFQILKKRLYFPLLALFLSGSSFCQANATETYSEDRLLLANASLQLGLDATALTWASEVINGTPQRPRAFQLYLLASYNLWIENPEACPDWRYLNQFADLALKTATQAEEYFVLGAMRYNMGDKAGAALMWRNLITRFPKSTDLGLAALIYTTLITENELLRYTAAIDSKKIHPLLLAAIQMQKETYPSANHSNNHDENYTDLSVHLERLLPTRSR
jgi:hypothetical protein